jgi:hypothetical protein
LAGHCLIIGDNSQCARLGKICEYSAERKPYGVPETHQSPSTFSASPIATSAGHTAPVAPFPDAFFFDSERHVPVPALTLENTQSAPIEIRLLVDSEAGAIPERYFSTVDTWLPFISRKRLKQGIQASQPPDAGIALLLLCMKLASDSPQQWQHGASAAAYGLYKTARIYQNTVEEISPMSLATLQALVLIGLYEIGHGIFPAAFLTVGRAARLALLRGAHDRKNATQLFQTPPTWTYWEEERRTWWAIMILDRSALNPGIAQVSTCFLTICWQVSQYWSARSHLGHTRASGKRNATHN